MHLFEALYFGVWVVVGEERQQAGYRDPVLHLASVFVVPASDVDPGAPLRFAQPFERGELGRLILGDLPRDPVAGNDLRNMTPEIREILINKEVIAVDQDKLGKAGSRLTKGGDTEVWSRPLDKGAYAVALFNRGESEADVSVKWSDLKLSGSHKVRDLWAHADRGGQADGFTAKVAPHGVVMIRVSR